MTHQAEHLSSVRGGVRPDGVDLVRINCFELDPSTSAWRAEIDRPTGKPGVQEIVAYVLGDSPADAERTARLLMPSLLAGVGLPFPDPLAERGSE